MTSICPTVTASEPHAYRAQMELLLPFAKRIHVDLMDGVFAPTKSPGLDQIWLPAEAVCDIHLMYQKPMECLDRLIKLRPRLVVIHNEADVHHMHFAALLHREGIKAGLALLHDTPAEYAYQVMHSFDHVLIFSGKLGYHGGTADLGLLEKVKQVRAHHPEAEIGWDGGVNEHNARQLAEAGVNVLNVGGYIHDAGDPAGAYAKLKEVTKAV
jgi:ribulose-phosphate 3-epimerase